MATVSDKYLLTLKATLLASVLITGCSSLMPVERLASDTGNADGVVKSRQQVMTPADDVPLPRQTYNSTGEKVPYVPQPNPYTTATDAIPAEARSRFVVASGLLQEGKLKEARSQFKKLTEKYPTLSGPWIKLGAIAEKREKYDEAIRHYKKAISVNRNNVNAYIALGLLQRTQGYFSDAQHTYLDALNVWSDFPEAHLNLAILYDLYVNKPEEAQKHYEAYYFLTREKDEKVHKWLVEVKQRTGIERSFIDIPPKDIAKVHDRKADDPVAAAAAGSPG